MKQCLWPNIIIFMSFEHILFKAPPYSTMWIMATTSFDACSLGMKLCNNMAMMVLFKTNKQLTPNSWKPLQDWTFYWTFKIVFFPCPNLMTVWIQLGMLSLSTKIIQDPLPFFFPLISDFIWFFSMHNHLHQNQ